VYGSVLGDGSRGTEEMGREVMKLESLRLIQPQRKPEASPRFNSRSVTRYGPHQNVSVNGPSEMVRAAMHKMLRRDAQFPAITGRTSSPTAADSKGRCQSYTGRSLGLAS
jgi:hypothetical protein